MREFNALCLNMASLFSTADPAHPIHLPPTTAVPGPHPSASHYCHSIDHATIHEKGTLSKARVSRRGLILHSTPESIRMESFLVQAESSDGRQVKRTTVIGASVHVCVRPSVRA